MGSDSFYLHFCPLLIRFNPRSRMGSDNIREHGDFEVWKFQSTLPYGERPDGEYEFFVDHYVSIHAPVWGATDPKRSKHHAEHVSIHAPVWGATAITYNFFTIFRDCLCNYNNIIVLIQAY